MGIQPLMVLFIGELLKQVSDSPALNQGSPGESGLLD